MKFSKDLLAWKILCASEQDYSTLLALSRSKDYPQFEVRTIGSAGIVQIKFPSQEWISPSEWAENHVTTITRNLYNDIERLQSLAVAKECLNKIGYYSKDDVIRVLKEAIQESDTIFNEIRINQEAKSGVKASLMDNLESIIRLALK